MRKSDYFERNDSIGKIILIYLILLIACVITIYPILNILSISLRPGSSLFSTSLRIIPENATLQNYKDAFTKYDLLGWLWHSLMISGLAALFSVIVSITAGYAFSRFEFRGRKMGMTMLLVTQMFPATMMLLPLYLMLVKVGMINNYFGLIVVYVSTSIPFNIWMIKGYFDTIPKALEESAYVDGASILVSFFKIMLPLARPSIALVALFSFMTGWSEYIVANVIIRKESMLTLPVGLVSMQGQFTTDWGIYSAAALITAIPVMILFVSLSKYLVGGLTIGSVKG